MKKFTSSINPETLGLFYGFLGVLGFSLTLPATRVAVTDLNPVVVGLGRAVVASVPALLTLWLTRQPLPPRKLWGNIFVVAIGVIIGFPLLSALAMQQLPAAHGAIITGLVPLATAIVATVRVGERPSLKFWIASITGSATIILFVLISSGGNIQSAHVLLLGASFTAAIGYAEGGRLASILGGWQVICWALVFMAPVLIVPVALTIFQHGLSASPIAWLCFGYVSIISQFVAFFAWYHGMRVAGVARVSQIQLLQPFLTILFSAWGLREQVTSLMLLATCIVIACVIFGKQALIVRRHIGE
ncbi:putative carboxylate/amino acid/amine transporter [Calothrix sp. NIES-4071]|nr:putative carboxylate/amino acid/amine transporter [Calothrix sp. NIES-4071]BAZ58190.1 putative carboxylate/amino acid/amine transporter [Calothrix sp. NIES-4105]